MEIDKTSPAFLAAIRDFRRARQRAVLERLMAQLAGKSDDLLAYDEVSDKLRAGQPVSRGLQEIPLEAIAGSVSRYTDFTRTFLPRRAGNQQRWAEVKAVIKNLGEIPPITVYQLDQVYFVLDGNHRVSVARELGLTHIRAYVTEIQTKVPLAPDTQPDELICKDRYAQFLEKTRLDELRPGLDLSVTAPGQYRLLEEQIEAYRHQLGQQQADEVSYPAAAVSWHDQIYWPVVQIIRERAILRHFPHRTETDLYAWLVRRRAELKEELGWEVDPKAAASDLVSYYSHSPQHLAARLREKFLDVITPDPLEAGPPPGQWRQEHLPAHQPDRLFADILVAVTGQPANWAGLAQALVVAQRESGRLHALRVVASPLEQESQQNQQMQAEFQRRCRQAGVPGELTFKPGKASRIICDQARWSDLVVMHLSHLPRPQPGDRLLSGFGALVRRCPRPVLAVSGQASPLERALLAYDGSPKANEALFVAAYLAGKWQIPLVVVSVLEKNRVTTQTINQAQSYLAGRGVKATFVEERGTVAWAIIRTAQLRESDFIIMGGYGFNPILEVMLGSEVDQILRAKRWPVLICR